MPPVPPAWRDQPSTAPGPVGDTGESCPGCRGGDRAGTRPRLAEHPSTPWAAPGMNPLSLPQVCDENSPEWRCDSQVWSGVHVLINRAGEGTGRE